jgi:hypothetical protein
VFTRWAVADVGGTRDQSLHVASHQCLHTALRQCADPPSV